MDKYKFFLSFLRLLLLLLHVSSSSLAPEPYGNPRGGVEEAAVQNDGVYEEVRIGLVMDMSSLEGKIVKSSISMALSDFYTINNGYSTRVSISIRDSYGDPLQALASAVDLIENEEVEAIIGGQSLMETKLLAERSEKAKVAVISLHAPISSSLSKYTHLVQASHDPMSEAEGIRVFIHDFGWTRVVLVYEEEDDWRESMHHLVDHFHENSMPFSHKRGFVVSNSNKDYVMDHLKKLKALGSTVFVVHVSERLMHDVFSCAESLGMMKQGYAWILTAKAMNSLHYMDPFTKTIMDGVVGFRSYIPNSQEVHSFNMRWRRSLPMEPDSILVGTKGFMSIYGLRAHDMAWTLARAAEVSRAHHGSNGSALLEAITQTSFEGLSGHIRFINKKLSTERYEIINVIGTGERRVGLWSSRRNLSSSSSSNELETIIWPGGSSRAPKRRRLGDTSKEKLRVLVSTSNKFPRLIEVHTDPITGVTNAQGFCIEVFETAMRPFNYELEYIPWRNGSNYNNLAYSFSTQKDKYDAAVGDITITDNRSNYVDFTLPFTEMGIGVVAVKDKSIWIFFRPLTPGLWVTAAIFFTFTGIIVWLIERPDNTDFQGSWPQQIGTILWFGFSTLVYAQRERLERNLSRFVVLVWIFAVLILVSNYTATLTSMMTVQQMRLKSSQNYVGFFSGSLILNVAQNNSTSQGPRYRRFRASDDYGSALKNGTVSFIIDELPYINVILGEYPRDLYLVKKETFSNGFGFMFQKGNPLAQNVSREIAKLRRTERLKAMETWWFQRPSSYTTEDMSDPLTLYKFRGLFMITGASFAFALTMLLAPWLRKKRKVVIKSFQLHFTHHRGSFRSLFSRAVHPASFSTADTHNIESASPV